MPRACYVDAQLSTNKQTAQQACALVLHRGGSCNAGHATLLSVLLAQSASHLAACAAFIPVAKHALKLRSQKGQQRLASVLSFQKSCAWLVSHHQVTPDPPAPVGRPSNVTDFHCTAGVGISKPAQSRVVHTQQQPHWQPGHWLAAKGAHGAGEEGHPAADADVAVAQPPQRDGAGAL